MEASNLSLLYATGEETQEGDQILYDGLAAAINAESHSGRR